MTATKFKPWEPGDAMYARGDHPHSNYLYNFRDDAATDNCNCQDRADWPQQTQAALEPGDELGDFIADVKGTA